MTEDGRDRKMRQFTEWHDVRRADRIRQPIESGTKNDGSLRAALRARLQAPNNFVDFFEGEVGDHMNAVAHQVRRGLQPPASPLAGSVAKGLYQRFIFSLNEGKTLRE